MSVNELRALAQQFGDACASPKFCPPVISTAYGVAIHRQGAKALDHDNAIWLLAGAIRRQRLSGRRWWRSNAKRGQLGRQLLTQRLEALVFRRI